MSLNATNCPAIELCGLCHAYREGGNQNTVLNNISATLHAEPVHALLGQSGSGKSTLLNLISGLEPIQSGDVKLFGSGLASLSDRQRTLLRRSKVGFVYQSFNLIPTLSVFENTALPLALNKVSRVMQQERVDDLLERIGLAGRQKDFPDQLSGGEQQRVAIARAMIHRPNLILADEPTGNLDANTGRMVLETLLSLAKDFQSTLLLVTHSREVASHAQAVWTLEDASLEQKDSDSAW